MIDCSCLNLKNLFSSIDGQNLFRKRVVVGYGSECSQRKSDVEFTIQNQINFL